VARSFRRARALSAKLLGSPARPVHDPEVVNRDLPALACEASHLRGCRRVMTWSLIGRFDMSNSKSAFIAAMILLSMGFVLYPQDSADAAKFCMQLRGTTAAGHVDCSFSTLDACRARVRHRGGGHCFKLHH